MTRFVERVWCWFIGGSQVADGLPEEWRRVLEEGFAEWALLSPPERERMELLIASFVASTNWEAARDSEVTDEMRVLIAAQACLLLLGLPIDEFPDARTVIVHPSTVVLQGRRGIGVGRVETSGPYSVLGQAHYQGPVLLSWRAVQSGLRWPTRGHNVVFHEFAHKLDMLDGTVDGTPPFDDAAARERWIRVFTAAYDEVREGEAPHVLRPYAGSNPGEFFAVATEVFFTRPVELRDQQPELYEELAGFYGQDPAIRQPTWRDQRPR
jgi:MtfA peptidase